MIDYNSRQEKLLMQEIKQEKLLIKRNILKYLDYKGLSQYEFYKLTGITRGVLNQNNGMSEENTAKYLAYFKEVNAEWLITGNGPMLKSEAPLAIPSAIPGDGIPLIPDHAMAGILQGDISVMELECERYVVPAFRGADFLIPVKGSSMYPKYSSGDIVACKKIPLTDLFFQWNKVYVLDTIQGPIIKRVAKGSDQDHILAVSENPKYEPFELHISQLRAVAIVMGVIRLE